jgi:hypothetical protein
MADYTQPQSTVDTLRNRPSQLDQQIDSIDPPRITTQPAPSATREMPVSQGTNNPANSVPADDEGFFHKVYRRFTQ